MMNDRELLELAAKAAGYPISEGYFEAAESPNAWWGWVYIDGDGEPPNDSAWTELWNPLTDDGDALRLAVALGKQYLLYLEIGRSGADVEFDSHNAQAFERGDDAAVATRRAIVRAAAEIGKQI
jgi:hypothetical protein